MITHRRESHWSLVQIVLLVVTCIHSSKVARGNEWRELNPIPDTEGLAGTFAGISHNVLLVAGGANFPHKKPWEGGAKVWHDQIFALDDAHGSWRIVGQLPRPMAYGVSVTHNQSVICVGGSDGTAHYSDTFRLSWGGNLSSDPLRQDPAIRVERLPPLPQTTANSCGALVGDILYVAGGQQSPDSDNTLANVYRINLSSQTPQWQEIEPLPDGGRMLSVAASANGDFWLFGGVTLAAGSERGPERVYLNDALRYIDGHGWHRLPDLPRAVAAAPTPAPVEASQIYLLGGDDGSQVGNAPESHKGFSSQILRFDIEKNRWFESGTIPAPRVTVPCVPWPISVFGNKSWVVPSGEKRPGIRSPSVWLMTVGSKE